MSGVCKEVNIFDKKMNGKRVGKTFIANSMNPSIVLFAYFVGLSKIIKINTISKIVIIKSYIFILLFLKDIVSCLYKTIINFMIQVRSL